MRNTLLAFALVATPWFKTAPPTVDSALRAWRADVHLSGLTDRLLDEWKFIRDSNKCKLVGLDCPKPHQRRRHYPAGVEQWRPLVAKYFPASQVNKAMHVMACESRGDPYAKNPHSSASGLFQHLARYWPERSRAAGWAGASIWDPEANIAVAAWLWRHAGWASWVCT